MDLLNVPEEPNFEMDGRYLRKELHDQFKGQRQSGISTPADHSFIFIFTDTESEEYGYSDRFLDNGLFVYSGEGQVGDMEMDGGNEQIRDHKQNGDSLYVFELVDQQNGAGIHSFIGEYEYVDHYWEQAPDKNEEMRQAIRFKLAPVGGIEADVQEPEMYSLSDEELFERAKQSANTKHNSTTGTSTSSASRTRYTRSEVIKHFARQSADGVCQGCGDDAPFLDQDEEPFLEVHHLHRRSDGGLDDPENVIAICPNCHREVHYGQNGDELNERLIMKAKERNNRLV